MQHTRMHTRNLPQRQELDVQPILRSYHHGNWTGVKSLYQGGWSNGTSTSWFLLCGIYMRWFSTVYKLYLFTPLQCKMFFSSFIILSKCSSAWMVHFSVNDKCDSDNSNEDSSAALFSSVANIVWHSFEAPRRWLFGLNSFMLEKVSLCGLSSVSQKSCHLLLK